MTASDNLYVLMQRLGMAAITQTTKTAQLAEQRRRSDISDIVLEREARAQLDQLLCASISFTARLVVVCDLGTAEDARELERKLVASLKASGTLSAEFQQAIENLAESALTYAMVMTALAMDCAATGADPTKIGTSVPAREQAHRLSRAAVTFTTKLTVACSADQEAASDMASEMEERLLARLDEVPWHEDDHE